MNEEKEHVLNKIANIVDFPEKEHESDEAIANEFYEFVQTMLDASAASNGTLMCVDTSIQAATYIYEKFLSILPKTMEKKIEPLKKARGRIRLQNVTKGDIENTLRTLLNK